MHSSNSAVILVWCVTHAGDTVAAVAAASMLRFNAGGHVNHSIFWQNLAPKDKTGEPSGVTYYRC